MSTLVDERIVTLQFDNKNFERNVSQSMETLEDLRESLDFDGVSNEINKSFKSVDPNPLIKVLDKVEHKISVLDIMFVTFVANMTNKLINLGERLVKSLSVDQVQAGWDKFQKKSISIGTLVSQGNDIEVVTEQMQKLNDYTDQTSYEFVAMSENIGKFTAAGQGLEDSVDAMIGIANWAATAGVEAGKTSAAMYQISQAMSAGVMRLQDYKSIQTAGMDTLAFRETVLETAVAMGKLNKTAEGTYKTIAGTEFDTTQITTTLSEGWFDRELMMETFTKYSKAFNKVQEYAELEENKELTANKLIAKFEEEKLSALEEEATRLAQIAEDTANTAASAEEIEAAYKAAEDAAKELEETKFGLQAYKAAQETRTLSQAIQATKDAVSSNWMNIFELVVGNYEQAKTIWSRFSDDLWDIFAEGGANTRKVLEEWNKLGGRDDLFSLDPENLGAFWNLVDAIKSIISAIKEGFAAVFNFGDTLEEKGQGVKRLTESIQSFSKKLVPSEKTLNSIKNIIKGIASAIKYAFTLIKAAIIIIKPFLTLAVKLIKIVLSLIGRLANSISNALGGGKGIINLAHSIAGAIQKVIDIVSHGISVVANFIRRFISFKDIKNIVVTTFNAVKNVFDIFFNAVKKVFNGIKSISSGAFDKILTLAGKMKSGLEKITTSIKSVVGGFNVFSKVGDKLSSFSTTVVNNSKSMVSSISKYATSLFKSNKANKENNETVATSASLLLGQSLSLKKAKDSEDLYSKATEAAAQKTSLFSKTIEFIKNILNKVWELVKLTGKYLLLLGNYLKSKIQPALEYVKSKLPIIGEAILKLFSAIGSLAKAIKRFVKNVIEFVKNSNILAKALNLLRKVFDILKTVGSKAIEVLRKGFKNIPNILNLVSKAMHKLYEIGKKLLKGIINFFGQNVIKNIGKFLSKTAKLIAKALNMISDAIKNAFNKKQSKQVTKATEEVQDKLSPILNLFKALGKLAKAILRLATVLIDALAQVFDKISDGIENIMAGKSSGINFREIISGTIFAIIGLNVAKGVVAMIDVLRALLNPIEDLFDGFRQSQLAKKWKEVGNFFKSFGLALLMITASLVILSRIPTDKLKEALKALGIIFAMITAFVVVLSAVVAVIMKLTGSTLKDSNRSIKAFGHNIMSSNSTISELAKVLQSFAILIASVGVSILLISFALQKIAGLEWKDIEKGLTAIGAVMLGLILMISVISGFKKSELKTAAKVINSFATSMIMLIIPIKILGNMPYDKLVKGITGTAVMLFAYAAVMAVVIEAGKTLESQRVSINSISLSMVAFGAACLLISIAFKKIDGVSWKGIAKGLTAIVPILLIFMAIMTLCTESFGGTSGTAKSFAILNLGIAFGLFTGALFSIAIATKILAEISWKGISKMLAMMGTIGAIFIVAEALATPKRAASMLLLGVAFALMAGAFIELALVTILIAALPTAALKKGLFVIGAVTLIFIALAVLATLSIIGSASMMMLGFAMLEISTSFLIMTLAIKKIADIDNKTLKKGIFVISAVTAIFVLIGVLATFAVAGSVGLLILGAAMITISLGIMFLITPIKEMAKIDFKTVITGILKIAAVLVTLAAVSLAIVPAIPLLLALGVALMLLSGAFLAVAIIADLSSATIARGITNICNDIIKTLPKVFETIEKFMEGLFKLLERLVPKWVDTLVTILIKIVNNLAKRADEIVNAIYNLISSFIKAIFNLLPGKIKSGLKTLGSWLGKKLKNFVKDHIISPIKKKLGINSPSTVFKEIGEWLVKGLWEGIKEKAIWLWTNIKGFVEDYIINPIKDFFGMVGDKASDIFHSIGEFLIEGLWNGICDKVKDTWNAIKDFFEEYIIDPIKDFFGIHSPSTLFEGFGEDLIRGLWNGIKNMGGWIKEKIEGFMGDIKDAFGKVGDFFEDVGDKITDGVGKAVSKTAEITSTAKDKVVDIADKVKDEVSNVAIASKNIGENIVDGIKSGMSNAGDKITGAAKTVGNKVTSSFKKVFKINSPSKIMIPLGESITEGVSVGIDEGEDYIVKSADNLTEITDESFGDKFKSIIKSAVDKAKQLFNNTDFDNTLTIKPILDMSDVENNKKQITDMFNGVNNPTISSTLRLATSVSTSSLNKSNKPIEINQNGNKNSEPQQMYTINNTFNVDGNTDVRTLAREISTIIQKSVDRRNYNYGK